MKDPDFIASLARGLQVIEAFGEDSPRHSIASAAQATSLDRATVRRCLLTLTELGYAYYDGKFFTLSPRILRLGTSCLAAMQLPHLLQPVLDQLSVKIGQSTAVSILDGQEIVYIARAVQRRVMSISLMPGARLPASCSSMGRVLLAALPEDEARSIIDASPRVARTPTTVTDPDELMARIALARTAGYATIDQEVELGLRSIAVPLKNIRGQTVAALTVGLVATQRSVDELVGTYLPDLLVAQEELRRILA